MHETVSGDRPEGDGGEHPPPPDRDGLHGAGGAGIPRLRHRAGHLPLAARAESAEPGEYVRPERAAGHDGQRAHRGEIVPKLSRERVQ